MKKAIKAILCLVLCVAACKASRSKDPIAFARDTDNGLRKELKVGAMYYTIQYKPAAYILEQERLDPAAAASRAAQLKGMAWFNISFEVAGTGQSPLRHEISGLEEYTARQDYFLNRASGDISLLYGSDTLRVDSYWFENNQNLTPYETMVVGFRLPDTDTVPMREMLLSYDDQIFHNGIIKAKISKEDLQ
jgi:hypothetical protein